MKVHFPFLITITVILFACKSNFNSFNFSVLTEDNHIVLISRTANDSILEEFFESQINHNFRKLILSHSNEDKLVVEQNNKDDFLVLLTLRHEQFVIKTPIKTLTEVAEIMKEYLASKDDIMKNIKFH